ncbi:MAG: BMP family ABC transporter substrate-binding protein [Oscillospiraceae bacterium]|nr:BMP family ABC transporter substrate-binding protein [Oscillospiraceae bacterium]
MKKLLSMLLALAMLLTCMVAFSACGDEAANNSGELTLENVKVGAIYITSQNDTAGYTFAHHNGITTAMEKLGIPAENLYIVDNVAEDDTAVSNAIDTLAGKGCNIIFGISFGYLNAMNDAAAKEEYANIAFSHATGYLANETNFNNYFGRIYQARYLAGIAAGLKSLELGNDALGYVAAYGTEYAETCSGINAFTMGALSVNPNAQVYVKTINAWADETMEKQAAESLINTYNVCVIAQHCDSAQPQLVAANAGVFGCGYNSDMTEQAPTSHITAPIWNWDVYYAEAIKAAVNAPASEFVNNIGIYYGGLKEGFVDISPINAAAASEGTEEIVSLVKDLIISGEWDVFSGVKLSYTQDADGNWTIVKTDADLVTNTGEVIVTAGGASVDDGVIKGSMNYYVAGVVAE